MAQAKRPGSIVSILCDDGERYRDTYFSDAWVAAEGLDLAPYTAALEAFFETGRLVTPDIAAGGA